VSAEFEKFLQPAMPIYLSILLKKVLVEESPLRIIKKLKLRDPS
jgi:hypothetical protein